MWQSTVSASRPDLYSGDVVAPRKPRRREAIENDLRILRAAVWCLDRQGVDGITTVGVATAAGFTTGALYSRYEQQHDLLADVWQRQSLDAVHALIAAALAVRRSGAAPHTVDALAALLADPPVVLRVGVQLMAVTRRIDELADVVPADLAAALLEHGVHLEAPDAAQVDDLGVVAFALGAVLLGSVTGAPVIDWTPMIRWCGAPPTAPLPWPPAPPFPSVPLRDPDDPAVDALLRATQQVIARSGVERATLQRISRAARLTPTVVYNRYENREELIVDLVRRIQQAASTTEMRTMVHASPEMLAMSLATLMSPQGQPRRRLALEVLLASVHHERLAAAGLAIDAESRAATVALLADRYGSTATAGDVLTFGAAVSHGAAVLVELGAALATSAWRPFFDRTVGAANDVLAG